MADASLRPTIQTQRMFSTPYVESLLVDAHLAVMVKTALDDGLIDRAAADLAWWLVRSGSCGMQG